MCSQCNSRKSRAALADMDLRTYVAKLGRRFDPPGTAQLEELRKLKAYREEQRRAYLEFVCLDTEE